MFRVSAAALVALLAGCAGASAPTMRTVAEPPPPPDVREFWCNDNGCHRIPLTRAEVAAGLIDDTEPDRSSFIPAVLDWLALHDDLDGIAARALPVFEIQFAGASLSLWHVVTQSADGKVAWYDFYVRDGAVVTVETAAGMPVWERER